MEKTKINITDEVAIHISNMNKWYGNFHVLRDINLEVMRGERIVVCGPSGSGKSTLIRCINRLEEHQKGRIIVDGTELTTDLKNFEFENKFKISWKLTDKIRLYNLGEISKLKGNQFYKAKIGLEYTF